MLILFIYIKEMPPLVLQMYYHLWSRRRGVQEDWADSLQGTRALSPGGVVLHYLFLVGKE